MDQATVKTKSAGAADFLANERTFLAWVRTSIALMGFGFVIVKFAVFLRQVAFVMGRQQVTIQNQSSAAAVGLAMVVLGALMVVLAYLRYRQIQKKLQENEYFPSRWLSFFVAVVLVAGSVILFLYLLPQL